MEITAALAADLGILSEALDGTGADLTDALRQLAADARLAVPSYVGLTVVTSADRAPLVLTALEPFTEPDDMVSSLLIPLTEASLDGIAPALAVILYAARPGALVDLAADLNWLTGRPLTDFVMDAHLQVPATVDSGSGIQATSLVNQAIGLLIGRGYTPEHAELELDARASTAGHTRAQAAEAILTDLNAGVTDTELDR